MDDVRRVGSDVKDLVWPHQGPSGAVGDDDDGRVPLADFSEALDGR